MAVTVGLPAGIVAATRRGTAADALSIMAAMAGVSMPVFWLGLLMMYLLAVRWRVLPPSTLGMGGAVLAETAASFPGLGVQPPTPSWGSMLAEARDRVWDARWLMILPELAIFVTVLAFNLLVDGLRDVLDPRLRT